MTAEHKSSGLLSLARMRALKVGFSLLVLVEILVGGVILWNYDAIYSYLGDLATAAPNSVISEAAVHVSRIATLSIAILLLMIIFGSIVGGALFWNLARYINLSALLTDFISDGIAITGTGWRVQTANATFAKITGWDLERLMDQSLLEILPTCKAVNELSERTTWNCEYEGARPDGSGFVASVSVFVLDRRAGKPTRSLITVKDITDKRTTEDNIRQMAYFDDLTGLPNRAQLQEKLTAAIHSSHEQQFPLALLYMDLDGFKDVNDSLGHEAGDELLKAVSGRFTQGLRANDFVARLGGDEFCVLLTHVRSEQQVAAIADRLLQEIESPLVVSERQLKPHASIGIAMYPRDGETRESLLQAADTAMYAAKRDGKHRYSYYQPELTRLVDIRLSMEHDLRIAVDEKQFHLVYQPQVLLKSGKMIGVEALIRWRHPKRGLISPEEFIPVAERIGVIIDIGDWVLEQACWQLKKWQEAKIELTVAVNISGSHFQDSGLYDTVEGLLEQTGVNPNFLELEITEGVMQLAGRVVENFHDLKELGIKIAIDDFGTGYSGLSSLKNLPLDHLKVDRAFLQDVFEDKKQAVIIGTIVGMGHALNMQVIVEGVETQDQLLFLQGLGCKTVQGYYFSKPVSPEKIPELYRHGLAPAGAVDAPVFAAPAKTPA